MVPVNLWHFHHTSIKNFFCVSHKRWDTSVVSKTMTPWIIILFERMIFLKQNEYWRNIRIKSILPLKKEILMTSQRKWQFNGEQIGLLSIHTYVSLLIKKIAVFFLKKIITWKINNEEQSVTNDNKWKKKVYFKCFNAYTTKKEIEIWKK